MSRARSSCEAQFRWRDTKGKQAKGVASGKRKCLLSNDIDNKENQCNMMASCQDLFPGIQEPGFSVLNAIKRGKRNAFTNWF
jgi:hypothetical protein